MNAVREPRRTTDGREIFSFICVNLPPIFLTGCQMFLIENGRCLIADGRQRRQKFNARGGVRREQQRCGANAYRLCPAVSLQLPPVRGGFPRLAVVGQISARRQQLPPGAGDGFVKKGGLVAYVAAGQRYTARGQQRPIRFAQQRVVGRLAREFPFAQAEQGDRLEGKAARRQYGRGQKRALLPGQWPAVSGRFYCAAQFLPEMMVGDGSGRAQGRFGEDQAAQHIFQPLQGGHVSFGRKQRGSVRAVAGLVDHAQAAAQLPGLLGRGQRRIVADEGFQPADVMAHCGLGFRSQLEDEIVKFLAQRRRLGAARGGEDGRFHQRLFSGAALVGRGGGLGQPV